MKKIYSSKISYGLLLFTPVISLITLVLFICQYDVDMSFFLVLSLLIIVNAFVLHLFLKTDYAIEDEQLKIRSGFSLKKPIAISDIKAIRKTNSIIGSPAAFFDRIEI